MKYIPCTIRTLRSKTEDAWIVSIPFNTVENASELLTELLSETRKKLVFLDGKTEFIITAASATYQGRSISISKNFLQCLEGLFSRDICPGRSHIDFDFSDKHGDIGITVRIQ